MDTWAGTVELGMQGGDTCPTHSVSHFTPKETCMGQVMCYISKALWRLFLACPTPSCKQRGVILLGSPQSLSWLP